MNIKSLALSALVALSTFGGVAEAAPSTCAYRQDRGAVTEVYCDVHKRTNANGHNVFELTFYNNGTLSKMSVVLWKDNGTPCLCRSLLQRRA